MVTPDQKPDSTNAPAGVDTRQQEVYLENASIDSVHGENVHIHQSSVNHIVTEEIALEDSRAQFVDAQTITAHQSMMGTAHTETLTLDGSDAGVVYAENVTATGNMGAIFANAVTMNQSQAGVIVSLEMQGDRIQSVILIAGRVNGPVETKLDARNALIFGAVAGAVVGIIISLLRLTKKHK